MYHHSLFEQKQQRKRINTTIRCHAQPSCGSWVVHGSPVSAVETARRAPQRLLLGIDLYHNELASMEMCEWVLQHVYCPGDCLVLVHCIVPIPMLDVYSLPDGKIVSSAAIIDMMKMQDAIEEEMTRAMETFEQNLKKIASNTVEVESHVVNHKTMYTTLAGSLSEKKEIAELMCQTAVDLKADAMFVASNARGGLAEVFEGGSVAADVVRHADIPVVVYRSAKMRQVLKRSPHAFEERILGWLEKIGGMYSKKLPLSPETTAVSAAAGPVYGHVTIGEPGVVSTEDLDDDGENLIGQTICEIPGLDYGDEEFDASGEEHQKSKASRAFLLPVQCDSDVGMHALEWISNTLYRPGDVLVLLHIIPSVPFMVPSMPSMGVAASTLLVAESITHEYEESCQNVMNQTYVPYLHGRGIDYKLEILVELSDGSTEGLGEAIINRAKEWEASAIALGSHSRGGLGEFFLGSIANYVDHHSPIPVIVIH
jgi:nucleotide-binding universal stress UspA family protein